MAQRDAPSHLLEVRVRSLQIKHLVACHHGHEILRIRQIDDIMNLYGAWLQCMTFSPSLCKIYNSIVSIIFFNESADSLSFNASSPLKLIGISDSIPSAPTIAGILNDTPSISYTP